MHIAHAVAVLLVDQHGLLHPVVASPRLEVPMAKTSTDDCPLAVLIHVPEGPGITTRVDCFGLLPVRPRRNTYIVLNTDRFSRRAKTFAVTAAKLTAAGRANILVMCYIPLWICPCTILSDNGLQFCFKRLQAVYQRMGVHKLCTSSHHPNGNEGVARVNHTMAEMLAAVAYER